jgi:hypothetical protein
VIDWKSVCAPVLRDPVRFSRNELRVITPSARTEGHLTPAPCPGVVDLDKRVIVQKEILCEYEADI